MEDHFNSLLNGFPQSDYQIMYSSKNAVVTEEAMCVHLALGRDEYESDVLVMQTYSVCPQAQDMGVPK